MRLNTTAILALSFALTLSLVGCNDSSSSNAPAANSANNNAANSDDNSSGENNGDNNANNSTANNNTSAPDNTLPEPLAGEIQGMIDAAVAAGLPGVIVYVETPEGVYIGGSGVADKMSGTSMQATTTFRIASNSKAFLGVLAAKLHAEGDLDLDDPITDHLETEVIGEIANADTATLRQLLTHTSGIYDYLGDDGFWDAVMTDGSRMWTAEEALAYARGGEASFATGTSYAYSNSNYLLAGLVLDTILGQHHAAAMRSHIFEPLELDTAWYEHHDAPMTGPGPLAHGYGDETGDVEDYFDFDTGYGLADGGLVMAVGDLATFLKAVSDEADPFLSADARASFLEGPDLENGERYGLGISIYEGDLDCYGHGGQIDGYQSDMFSWPEAGVTLVVFANATGDAVDGTYGDLVFDLEDAALAE